MVISKINAIYQFIKNHGEYVEGCGHMVDRLEYKDFTAMVGDGGYSIQISGPNFAAWADLGCQMFGFFRGGEEELKQFIMEYSLTVY